MQEITNPRRHRTFRARLTWATTLLCLGVLVTAGSVVYWSARQALRASLDISLLHVAGAEVASSPRPELVLSAGGGYEKFGQVENGADQIIARTENLRLGTPLPPNPELETKARAGQVLFSEMRLHGAPLRAIYYPFRDAEGHSLLAIIATPEEPIHRALNTLLESLGLSLLIAGGLAALGANRLARHLTSPLERIAQAAHSVGGTNLQARIPSFSPDAELEEVTEVLNDMLTRLEAAFAAQSRFVADASHEIRSPLSNLRGTVEVALRRPRSPDEYRQTLGTALVEIERLSRLTADLLTLSRADTGQFAMTFSLCDLGQVAAEGVASYRLRAEEHSVRLLLDDHGLVPVYGDTDQLRQVLDNLLDNALRYAPAGSAITVSALTEGGDCCLRVADEGPGLEAADRERIFERFYRADTSRARLSGGLGLGLAISKAIAEAHGGRIMVQSQRGAGAAFTLCLPTE